MLIIMTSPDAVLRSGAPDPKLVNVLIEAKRAGNPVAFDIEPCGAELVFRVCFGGSGVQFFAGAGPSVW